MSAIVLVVSIWNTNEIAYLFPCLVAFYPSFLSGQKSQISKKVLKNLYGRDPVDRKRTRWEVHGLHFHEAARLAWNKNSLSAKQPENLREHASRQ